jgi:hypothetical protein
MLLDIFSPVRLPKFLKLRKSEYGGKEKRPDEISGRF